MCCYIMVAASHVVLSHFQQVLMLAALLTYFAPLWGSIEASLHAFAYISVPSNENVTVVYEVMNAPAAVVDFD
jgi:hypothetical protein